MIGHLAMRAPQSSRFFIFSLSSLLLLTLAACGGGGEKESVVPTVSSANARPAGTLGTGEGNGTFGQKLLITINGGALDNGITVLSNACSGVTRLTAAPTESNATTAYYECTVTRSGAQSAVVLRDISNFVLSTVPFTVPTPQVAMTVGDGARSLGSFTLTLNPNLAPVTVVNFMEYVRSGFFIDTIFHRYVPGFVIQGGGFAAPLDPSNPNPTTKDGARPPIVLEDASGLANLQWTVAMARTNDFNSATSQFFVNLVNNPNLDRSPTRRGFAVFGNVSAGTEVITAMTQAPCVNYPALQLTGATCLPLPNLRITAATQVR